MRSKSPLLLAAASAMASAALSKPSAEEVRVISDTSSRYASNADYHPTQHAASFFPRFAKAQPGWRKSASVARHKEIQRRKRRNA